MKRYLLFTLLALGGCSQGVTSPTVPAVSSMAVEVSSLTTGQANMITYSVTDPQPPSCAWRDLVIAKHLALGGRTNDIVTLANLHKVFIQDTGNGYLLIDYPGPWCVQ